MKIAAIDITRHRIPLDPPVPVSWDSKPRESFTFNLVRVRTDQGLEGVAAGDSMGGFAEHADLFLGRDPRDMERHHAVLDNLCFHYGRWWPLDLALWDLRGKIEGEPVFRLLANAHLTVGIGGAPYLEFPFDPPDWVPARRDFGLKETIEVDDDGWLTLPDRPGLGAELDEDVLRDTLVDGAG